MVSLCQVVTDPRFTDGKKSHNNEPDISRKFQRDSESLAVFVICLREPHHLLVLWSKVSHRHPLAWSSSVDSNLLPPIRTRWSRFTWCHTRLQHANGVLPCLSWHLRDYGIHLGRSLPFSLLVICSPGFLKVAWLSLVEKAHHDGL